MKFPRLLLLPFVLGVLGTTMPAQGTEGGVVVRTDVRMATTDNYPLDTCIACDKALGGHAEVLEIEGRKFKTCSAPCKPAVEKDPKAMLRKLDAAVVVAQAPGYPALGGRDPRFSRCLICRADLAKAEAPVSHVTKSNVMVVLCSEACAAGFDEHKSARQRHEVAMRGLLSLRSASHTAKACAVCAKELGEGSVWVGHSNTLVKVCGDECLQAFKLTPNTFVTRLAAASKDTTDKGATDKDTSAKKKDGAAVEKPPIKK